MKIVHKMCLGAAVIAALAGCHMLSLSAVTPKEVKDKVWVLTSMNGTKASGPRVTLTLTPSTDQTGKVTGQAQCNSYYGTYQIANNAIGFSPMGGTRAACPSPFMTLEAEYLATFPHIRSIGISGNKLTLSSTWGGKQLVFAEQSAQISGQLKSKRGKIPAGSEVIMVVQDSAIPDDPVGVIGMNVIDVPQDTNVLNYTIDYAPESVNPEVNYEVVAEVLKNGNVLFMITVDPSVNLLGP